MVISMQTVLVDKFLLQFKSHCAVDRFNFFHQATIHSQTWTLFSARHNLQTTFTYTHHNYTT